MGLKKPFKIIVQYNYKGVIQMFESIIVFLEANVVHAFSFLGDILSGGIELLYDVSGLTELGQLVLLTSLIGLGLWGLNFVIKMLPFTNMGKR